MSATTPELDLHMHCPHGKTIVFGAAGHSPACMARIGLVVHVQAEADRCSCWRAEWREAFGLPMPWAQLEDGDRCRAFHWRN